MDGEERQQDQAAVEHVADEARHLHSLLLRDRLHHEVGRVADVRVGPHRDRTHADRRQDRVGDAHHLAREAQALRQREERQIGRRVVEK